MTKYARIHWNPANHQFPVGARCVVEVNEYLQPISAVLDDVIIVPGTVYTFDGEYEGLVRVPIPVRVLPVTFDTPEEAARYTEGEIADMYYDAEGERNNALKRLGYLAIGVALFAALIGLVIFLRSQGGL